MTTDSQQAVVLFQKEQKLASKLKKLQGKHDSSPAVSEADQAAVARLQKKLKKARKQLAAVQQLNVDTAPSTESEDTVAIPADSSAQVSKKSKKRPGQ